MGDPVTPSLGFAVSAVRFLAQLSSVRDETGVVIDQVKIVTNDITEAERLFSRKKAYMSDADQSRVEEVIRSTGVAVYRIAREVERARKSIVKVGTVNGFDRFDWVLRRSGSTETYQHSLETCHRSLLDRISMLRGVHPNAGRRTFPLTESVPVGSHDSGAAALSDSDGNDDDASSGSPALDGTDPTEDLGRTALGDDGIVSTNVSTHPERALYEASLLNHSRKHKVQRPTIHPERLRYEEMQQRYKQRTP
ncbi:MAG: hypothetical protein LQ343_000176 [Gyalolechia ehrenbergii]|nr:MAG: hypothetical protein LQ343_000176 [Gyalolechia ehrenbergii]